MKQCELNAGSGKLSGVIIGDQEFGVLLSVVVSLCNIESLVVPSITMPGRVYQSRMNEQSLYDNRNLPLMPNSVSANP